MAFDEIEHPCSHTVALRSPAPLAWALLAAIGGIVADRLFFIQIEGTLFAGLLALFLNWLTFGFATRYPGVHRNQLRIMIGHLSVIFAIACLASAWHHSHWHLVDQRHVVRFAHDRPTPCCLRGQITSGATHLQRQRLQIFSASDSPDSEILTVFEMRIESIRDGREWRSATGRCRVELFAMADLPPPGTCIEIFGQLSQPRQARNPGDFDLRSHLRSQGLLVILRADSQQSIRRLNVSQRQLATRWRHWIRRRFQTALDRGLSREDAALASAMLLGQRSRVSPTIRSQFAQTGTGHLLSISGLHLAILAAPWFLLGRSGLLPMRVALLVAILFAWSFCWLIEFRTPVTRAAILISMFCSAKLLGRPALHWNTIALAGLTVLAVNPSELFATGAQLSFVAVITIAHSQKRCLRQVEPLTELRLSARAWHRRLFHRALTNIGWSLRLSGVVWLVTTPLVACEFHLLTPIAVLVNPLTMVAVTVALYSAVLLIMAEMCCLPIGAIVGIPAELGFDCLRLILRHGSMMPGAWMWTAGPSEWWQLGFYFGLLCHFGGWMQWLARRWRCCLLGIWCACGLLPDYQQVLLRCGRYSSIEATTTVLDVGHGAAIVSQLPNGQVFLYDAGSMGGDVLASERISHFLWAHRISHIDAIFVSHADVDHYNGLQGLVDRFTVGVVYVEPSIMNRRIYPWESTRKRLRRESIPLRGITAGSSWRCGVQHNGPSSEYALEILHPKQELSVESDNERSLILKLSYGSQRVLLTGDIEGLSLENWLNNPSRRSEMLMAPHHGSGLIPIHALLREIRPDAVVISGGWNTRSESILRRYGADGAICYHTALHGAITLKLKTDSLSIDGFLSPRDDGKQLNLSQSRR